jgi:hypothetical protein
MDQPKRKLARFNKVKDNNTVQLRAVQSRQKTTPTRVTSQLKSTSHLVYVVFEQVFSLGQNYSFEGKETRLRHED